MKMQCLVVAAVTFALVGGATSSQAQKPKADSKSAADSKGSGSDIDALQGSWRFSSMTAEGEQVPASNIQKQRFTLKGDHFTITAPEGTDGGTIKIDASKHPKTIDLVYTEGSRKGETVQGIYELRGSSLKICLSSTAGRPKDFGTRVGQIVENLTRAK